MSVYGAAKRALILHNARSCTAVLLIAISTPCGAAATQGQTDRTGAEMAAGGPSRAPMSILDSLADHLYVLGEKSGNVAEMIAAEAEAAVEIREYIKSGPATGLLAADKGKYSPLAAAAYRGYPNVVAALLTSDMVRASINDADATGLTPWIAANLSMQQSMWTCNPATFDNPFGFMPMLVTQPFYTSNPTPPYAKTRKVLEDAGASSNMADAKLFWLTKCENQLSRTRAMVKSSTDLQKTVQELGASDLKGRMRGD